MNNHIDFSWCAECGEPVNPEDCYVRDFGIAVHPDCAIETGDKAIRNDS